MVKEINFRSITLKDADLLLDWRNDTVTRKNSLGGNKISKREHMKWIKSMLAHKADNLLLIAEWEGKPIGSFRIDKFKIPENITVPDMRLISYVVAPEYRHKGFGYAIVREGCVSYGQEYNLIAKIKGSNEASKKILEACDFECIGEVEKGILAYVRSNTNPQAIH